MGVCMVLSVGNTAAAGGLMSGQDVSAALGEMREGARFNAIASLARSGQIRSPLSAAEGALILAGTTQGARASSIGDLARLLKDDMTGQEAAAVLGLVNGLSEVNRFYAIAALARAKRFGPSLGGDAALALDGASQGSRASAIGDMAPYLRTDMRGQQVAAILGSEQVLSEVNRFYAIAALARSDRMPQALTAAEGALILAGTTQGARASSIGDMARFFVPGLSGEDIAAILGRNGESTEGSRFYGIASLVRAGRVRQGLGGQDLATVLKGMSGSARASAIAELASAVPAPAPVASPATATGPTAPSAQTPVALTNAEILRRIESGQKLAGVALSYMYDTSTFRDTFNVAAMNWLNLGSEEVRNLYDQLYLSAQQYQGRAIRSLSRAKAALTAGDAGAAAWFVRTADFNLKQMRATYSASLDLYAGDLQAAERTAKTLELAGSVAEFAIGVGAAPALVAMLNGVDFVGGVLAAGVEGGWGQATKEVVARALTAGIIKFVPLDVLGGKTIEEASKQTARNAMSDLRLQAALRRSLADPALRAKVAAWAIKTIELGTSELARAKLKTAISDALAKMAQGTQPL